MSGMHRLFRGLAPRVALGAWEVSFPCVQVIIINLMYLYQLGKTVCLVALTDHVKVLVESTARRV